MMLKIYNDLLQQILCFSRICRFLPTKIKVIAIQAEPVVLDAKRALSRGYPSGKPVLGARCGYAHFI
jgi:hypothetical protein